jgi:hypothetical protein
MELSHNEDLRTGRTTAPWENICESPRRINYPKGSTSATKGVGRPRKTESQWTEGNVMVTILGKRGVKHHKLVSESVPPQPNLGSVLFFLCFMCGAVCV